MTIFSNKELTDIVSALKNSQKLTDISLNILEQKIVIFERILKINSPELEKLYQYEVHQMLQKIDFLKK